MKRICVLLSVAMLFVAVSAQAQSKSTPEKSSASASTPPSTTKSAGAAAKSATTKTTKFSAYHAGPWEEQIGYAQAVRAGHTIYISGTVGADDKGFPDSMESQMKLAYAAIRTTMEHYGADFSNVVMERISTTDMDALIKAQETRKTVYGKWLPAATWVEVKRLYVPEAKIEIEVELVVE